jgi:hypothetical protein
MSAFLAILPILGALIPFVINQITRRQARLDDPKTQNANAYAEIDKQIANGNSNALTLGGGADLDRLDRLSRSANGHR